jgi:hypothetical protein
MTPEAYSEGVRGHECWKSVPTSIRLAALSLAVAICAGCGDTVRKPAVVHLRLGETRVFTQHDLPALSVIKCRYRNFFYSWRVPRWNNWDPKLTYGWFRDGVPGTGEGSLAVRPEQHGKALRATCQR